MKSKYELPFSTAYVPDWTIVEACRELFQNALDNEIKSAENKMLFDYSSDSQVLRVCSKTSTLEMDSLLLGSTTKANDKHTIGRHGEGYKLAFLVLLREGKKVTVYNYGKREVWESKLVKSKRYNGQLVPVITIDKEAFWKQVPDNDLTIEVGNVTEDEYSRIVERNLNLQNEVRACVTPNYGRILLDEKEKGNLYVKGLYVCHESDMEYGYDFEPSLIELDRDRKLLPSFSVMWNTSAMWKIAFAQKNLRTELLSMLTRSVKDVRYLSENTLYGTINSGTEVELANSIATQFIRKHGGNAIPVKNNDELQAVQSAGSKAVMVNDTVAAYIERAEVVTVRVPVYTAVSDDLYNFAVSITDRLTDEEADTFRELIAKVRELETK